MRSSPLQEDLIPRGKAVRKSLTVVVAVYNAVRYLEFVLTALLRQSMRDFEVVVADDGSGPEITKVIENTIPLASFPVKHLWQPDEGFRKNAILNKAIEASETDYLVFIDGDCIPHHKFVQDHWTHRESRGVLCGRRVLLSKSFSDRLRLEDVYSGRYEKFTPQRLLDGLTSRSSHLEEAIRIESPLLRKILRRKHVQIVGCNFSLKKNFLEDINGFNQDYTAPGLGEDSDVAHRLQLIGVRLIDLRHLAILYHLYHPHTTEGEENRLLYVATLGSRDPVCRNGIRKLR